MGRCSTAGSGFGLCDLEDMVSTTRVAFINYQVITLGQIARANDNDRIKILSLDVDELEHINRYDMILINGMGLRITEEQRSVIQDAANKGLAVITTMATNPANEIISADSATVATITAYLNGGGRRNYRNMLTYIRRSVDGKTFDSENPDAPIMRELKQFYHADPEILMMKRQILKAWRNMMHFS